MFGPVFPVEMVTSSRRTRYFVVRVLYALALFFVLAMNYSESTSYRGSVNSLGQSANVAGRFFFWFTPLQLLMVLMVGPAIAAGTIAVERERRTIEYLFATDLTNREIVFGKLTARLFQIGYLVLSGLPILALAMLMGGIAPEQLAASFLITLSTMLTVAMLAVAVSVWAPRVRDAITRVYVILFGLLVVPGALARPLLSSLGVYDWIAPLNDGFIVANPFTAFTRATLYAAMAGGNIYWSPIIEMLIAQGIGTAAMAVAATWAVRRVHLREAGKAPPKPGSVWGIRHQRRRRMGEHPMIWKEMGAARAAGKLGILGRIALWLIVGGVVVYTLIWSSLTPISNNGIVTVVSSDFLACGGLLLVAARAAGSITNEREKDTWITLLSTPLSAREIVLSKVLGNLYTTRWLLGLLGFLWLLQTLRTPNFIVSVPFTGLVLGIVGFFAATLGTNYSLRCGNSTRAFGATLGTAVFAGGGYLFCCMPVMIGGHGGQVILAACVPFLLACPGVRLLERHVQNEDWMTVVFGVGCLIYGAAGITLYQTMISSFDRINGRIEPGHRE